MTKAISSPDTTCRKKPSSAGIPPAEAPSPTTKGLCVEWICTVFIYR